MEMSLWLILAVAAGALLFLEYAVHMGWVKSVSPDEDDNPAPAPPSPDIEPVEPSLADLKAEYDKATACRSDCKATYDAACERYSTAKAAYREALKGEQERIGEELSEVADVPQP